MSYVKPVIKYKLIPSFQLHIHPSPLFSSCKELSIRSLWNSNFIQGQGFWCKEPLSISQTSLQCLGYQ